MVTMYYKNKYNIEMPNELVVKYYDNLIKDFYKCLPIFEGCNFRNKEIIHSPEEAYKQYLKYVENFISEINGGYSLFDENVNFLRLLISLESMLLIEMNEHDKLESLVFKCINICNKLKEEIGDGT